jgi:hypothetical protein
MQLDKVIGSRKIMENDSTAKPHSEISQWVIYDHPRDYPDHFVMRRWGITAGNFFPTDDVALADTLPEIRQAVPPGLYCLERYANDDPCIVEVWI